MKVTVCFDNVRVVVPCGDGTLLVRDLMHEAILRYRKATGKTESGPTITSLSSLSGGGLLDPDDRLIDVADDREQIVAHFLNPDVIHAGGDGASSVGTNSPDFFPQEHRYIDVNGRLTSNIKRESVKRLSMHALSTREPSLMTYSALSLPRESRRREPLGQDSKAVFELTGKSDIFDNSEIHEIIIKNEAGPLGLHVVPCYDLLGNDQGLRVERIEPNGRIAKDGQIDLHDKIIKINGHNLLRIPFQKVQDIFRICMSESCLKISVVKNRKNIEKKVDEGNNTEKNEHDDGTKKLQSSNYNLLQNANTRKIGRMIEIQLTKGTNGLGFSVTTRDNPAGGHCPIYIKNILPKGAAVEDGRLRPGDRLLEVNRTKMTGKSQSEVVSLLRSIPPGGEVHITVSRQEEITNTTDYIPETSPDVPITIEEIPKSPTKKLDTLEKDMRNFKSDEIVLSPKKNRVILTLDIPVHDSEKAGLGVSVKGKTNSADDNTNVDLGIFIKSVLHGGAASRDGRLRTNDQLLNVNGVSLLTLSNSDAMETLRRAMLNTNSAVTGVITLTIARRVSSSYDNNHHHHHQSSPVQDKSLYFDNISKSETANSIFISDDRKINTEEEPRISDMKYLNSDTHDGGLLSASTSPWNPVIDRLTEQYNKNSLRNESYCLATNKTWMDPVLNSKKFSLGLDQDLLEESGNENSKISEIKKTIDDKDSQYSGEATYDSQLSLEEFNSSNKFSRDAVGRQSMSEKRHAALDAKNTDTYKRNKKIREGRNKESGSKDDENEEKMNDITSKSEDSSLNSKKESSFEAARKKFEKSASANAIAHSNLDPNKTDYVYTIPGCNNKFLSPRKHWLVDDGHGDALENQSKDVGEGFSNSRGDVKQASLNSALDERYKRTKKKGGIRSMLRLGKNRKSLNFGDNIEARHETIFRSAQWQMMVEQRRFKSKINIQRPKKSHYTRAVVEQFLTPIYAHTRPTLPLHNLCKNIEDRQNKLKKIEVENPYHEIIGRELLNWFKNSRMIGFFHRNSMDKLEEFEFAVPLRRENMYLKYYQRKIFECGLGNTPYENVMPLFCSFGLIVFSPEPNVGKLVKIAKKTPQVTLMAGMLDGKLLNLNDFLKYGKMDLMSSRVELVRTLQTAGGANICRQLTHHQTTFVNHLGQIEKQKNEEEPAMADEN